MSEFKCLELGCDYHVFISGGFATEDDCIAQEQYEQDIEDHLRMHEERRVTPGQRLKALRAARGLDQEELAKKMSGLGLGWSRATLSKVERGQRQVRLEEVPYICMALGLEKIQDFWSPGNLKPPEQVERPGSAKAVGAIAKIRRILHQLDSVVNEKSPAAATAEDHEIDNSNA